MNIDQVKTWGFSEIKSFVNGANVLEGWYHDFKGISLGDTERIRRIFCSFANTNGGFILHGINNDIKIVGIDRDTELKTKVNRKIKNGIGPPIPIKSWDINEIKLPQKSKYVYLLYIYPSLYFDRPHITDKKVYVRGNGTCDPIEDGSILRKLFLVDKFSPSHIYQLENELDKIKQCKLNPDAIDFMYFLQLRGYLENRLADSEDFNDLLDKLRKVIRLYEAIRNIFSAGATYGESVSATDNERLNSLHNDLETLVEDFIKNFKDIHNL